MKIQNLTRGLRNNNPGNIRRNYANNWKGMSDVQSDISFVQFISLEYGLRALMRLLITYNTKYSCNTIRDYISRYAPFCENDTNSYVKFVEDFFASNYVCFSSLPLNISHSSIGIPTGLSLLVRAICKYESNFDPSGAILNKAYSLL